MGLFDGLFKKNGIVIASPAVGSCVPIQEVPDPTFGEEILGKGAAIKPSEGKFYAPADGEINTVFPTLHAIGMTTSDGAELLIHVGLDTVNLKGEHFKAYVQEGDAVKKGDLLLEADLEAIAAAGYQTITPIVVCNSADYKEIIADTGKEVTPGDTVLQIKG